MLGCLIAFFTLVVTALVGLSVQGYTTPGVTLVLLAAGLGDARRDRESCPAGVTVTARTTAASALSDADLTAPPASPLRRLPPEQHPRIGRPRRRVEGPA